MYDDSQCLCSELPMLPPGISLGLNLSHTQVLARRDKGMGLQLKRKRHNMLFLQITVHIMYILSGEGRSTLYELIGSSYCCSEGGKNVHR